MLSNAQIINIQLKNIIIKLYQILVIKIISSLKYSLGNYFLFDFFYLFLSMISILFSLLLEIDIFSNFKPQGKTESPISFKDDGIIICVSDEQ